MCGNGCGTFMVIIPVARRLIRMVLPAVPTVCFVAVAGATVPATAPFRVGTTTMQPARASALASAVSGFSLDFRCRERAAMYRAAEVCSAEAAKLPLLASSARCGKRILPPPSGCWEKGCRVLGCRNLFGRGSGAAFRSELRSLWQTDFATPNDKIQ